MLTLFGCQDYNIDRYITCIICPDSKQKYEYTVKPIYKGHTRDQKYCPS